MARAEVRSPMTAAVRVGCLCSAALLLAVVGCRDSHVIVAFGDSTTTWRGPTTNWVLLLRDELDFGARAFELVDSGVSSDTTELARDRFWWDVIRHRPDVTVIQFGINDALARVDGDPPAVRTRVDLDRYEANLRYFVERLREWDSEVVLMTPNPLAWSSYTREHYAMAPYDLDDPRGMNVLLDDYAEVVRQVAADEAVPLVDVQQLFESAAVAGGPKVSELLRDGVHPNDRAYRMLANALHPVLTTSVSGVDASD